MRESICTYRDLVIFASECEYGYEVKYAVSHSGCCTDCYYWWTDSAFDGCEETENLRKNAERLRTYTYRDGDFSVSEDVGKEKMLPEGKMALNFIYKRVVREDGTVPRIVYNGYIGDMVEQGIYYFDTQKGRCRPTISLGRNFDRDVAIVATLGYGLSSTVYVWYMALDRKHFKRLKQIANEMRGFFYHEFICDAGQEKVERQEYDANRFGEDGEELLPKLGVKDIEVSFELPLIKTRRFKHYDYARRVGNYLHLVSKDGAEYRCEEYDMRLMTRLEVRKKVRLRCGYEYDAFLKIIDCEEEKYKEILTPEAYTLYREQMEKMGAHHDLYNRRYTW